MINISHDSSIITYEAAKEAPAIHAFSIGFTEKEFDESEIAERFCREKNIVNDTRINASAQKRSRRNIRYQMIFDRLSDQIS